MKKNELRKLGVPEHCLKAALEYCQRASRAGLFQEHEPADLVAQILNDPHAYLEDETACDFAAALIENSRPPRAEPAPFRVWGEEQIDREALKQLETACRLPIAVRAALMPDAHVGYGLPIGGVLATEKAVVPYAVGVDIGCRMKMTVLDIPAADLERRPERYEEALRVNTLFGAGASWRQRRDHPVMDADWSVSPVTRQYKDKAWGQLGTSGGGNHFAEFGVVRFKESLNGVEADRPCVALLTHSGSRGTGALVCQHYSRIARERMPRQYQWARHLGWLTLDSAEGQEYWAAMNLMGRYASANHDVIHRSIVKHLGAEVLLSVENHHNFAWKEIHDGREVIVHRKGATPAGAGVLGVIPGSMADPAYVVRGKGEESSLCSAAHGAGRRVARNEARRRFAWEQWRPLLRQRGIRLLSAGLDEVPGVYKNIDEVMRYQSDLVEIIARFEPRIVRMTDDGSVED